jgi:four helix bundle protein
VGARNHRELETWKIADELRRRVWQLTTSALFGRQPWLRSQLRRSAQSACANIAEGFSRFRDAEFAHYLQVAKGSLLEVTEHLAVLELEGPRGQEARDLQLLARRSAGAATRLIVYLKNKPKRT